MPKAGGEDFLERHEAEIASSLALYSSKTMEELKDAYNQELAVNGHIYSISVGLYRLEEKDLSLKKLFFAVFLAFQIQKENKSFIICLLCEEKIF